MLRACAGRGRQRETLESNRAGLMGSISARWHVFGRLAKLAAHPFSAPPPRAWRRRRRANSGASQTDRAPACGRRVGRQHAGDGEYGCRATSFRGRRAPRAPLTSARSRGLRHEERREQWRVDSAERASPIVRCRVPPAYGRPTLSPSAVSRGRRDVLVAEERRSLCSLCPLW